MWQQGSLLLYPATRCKEDEMVLVLLYTVVAYRISPDIHFPFHGRGGNRLSLAAVAPLIVGQAYIVRLGDSCLRMFSLLCKLFTDSSLIFHAAACCFFFFEYNTALCRFSSKPADSPRWPSIQQFWQYKSSSQPRHFRVASSWQMIHHVSTSSSIFFCIFADTGV